MMNKQFVQICKKTQVELKQFLEKELSNYSMKSVLNADGFLYAQGSFPVLLVAHLDTVHPEIPKIIYWDDATTTLSSPQGIGGDDRCGIYMILQILKSANCSVVFCEDEEIGAYGAEKFAKYAKKQKLKFNYIIEFDRMNANDAVFYNCANKDFEQFITQDFYKTAMGSFSDISIIAPELKVAAVNLSCGYYNAHTKAEYVNVTEMNNSIKAAIDILLKTKDDDVFEYVDDDLFWYDDFEYKNYTIIFTDKNGDDAYEDLWARSKEEAIGKFLTEYHTLSYDDILDIEIDPTMLY